MAKHAKKEAGGLVEEKKPKIDARTPKDDDEMKESENEKDSFKKGGRAKKRKHGGHVEGEKPAHRLDKKASGGRMGGGHSPLSKASSVQGRPGGQYDGTTDKQDD